MAPVAGHCPSSRPRWNRSPGWREPASPNDAPFAPGSSEPDLGCRSRWWPDSPSRDTDQHPTPGPWRTAAVSGSGAGDAEQCQQAGGVAGVATQRGGDVVVAAGPQDADGEVARALVDRERPAPRPLPHHPRDHPRMNRHYERTPGPGRRVEARPGRVGDDRPVMDARPETNRFSLGWRYVP